MKVASGSTAGAQGRGEFERLLLWMLRDERAVAHELPENGRQAFLEYYAGLPDPGDEAAIARFLRGTWCSETGWVARWIAARRRAGRTARVLDSGAGFGTHAMLFAAAGAGVSGVDLRPDRLAVAAARVAQVRARLGLDLSVRCVRADLTRPWDADYDLVWVYNSLSHIDPPETFLVEARDHLAPDGLLVIGDINGAHPGHERRLGALRGQVRQEYVAPDGQRSGYAAERQFSAAGLRHLVSRCGYRIEHHELVWGGRGVLPVPLYERVLQPLQRNWRLGGRIARRQWLVAAAGT